MIKMWRLSAKCFRHFSTFTHLHAEQIFIENFHKPPLFILYFVQLKALATFKLHRCLCVCLFSCCGERQEVQWVCRVQLPIVWKHDLAAGVT